VRGRAFADVEIEQERLLRQGVLSGIGRLKASYTNRAEVHAPSLRLEATEASTKATPRARSSTFAVMAAAAALGSRPTRRAAINSAASR
jgi:hypothetical protein